MISSSDGLNGWALDSILLLLLAIVLATGCGSDGVITAIDTSTPARPHVATPTPVPPPSNTPTVTRPARTPTPAVTRTRTATRNPAATNCCVERTEPGCEISRCEACVCADDAFCCNSAWDVNCVPKAALDCQSDCGCPRPTGNEENAIAGADLLP